MKQKMKTQSGVQHILQLCRRQKNNERGESELKNIGEKPQDKHEIITHNTLINSI